MKNDLSFKILAAAVVAGLFLSLVDANSGRDDAGDDARPVAAAASAPATLAQR